MKNKVLIIAEAGVNHNGDIALAKKLVDVAYEAGADIVKFQTFKSENLVTKSASMAKYQMENTKKEESQYEMLKRLELSENDFLNLKSYCESKGIVFFSTGFDLESLQFLATLKMGIWKIPSGEITNLPYLEYIGKQNEKVILSTGMATLSEIGDAVNVLVSSGTSKKNITVLHCSTDYPVEMNSVNLAAMNTIKKEFDVNVGYSDHTMGIEVSIAAVALGATVIEKHFTLDRNMPGPDHKASLEPQELKQLVSSIRNIEIALGASEKKPSEKELAIKLVVRKSLVAKLEIKQGEFFSLDNLTVKRPGNGISPMKLNEVLGLRAKRTFHEDEIVEL